MNKNTSLVTMDDHAKYPGLISMLWKDKLWVGWSIHIPCLQTSKNYHLMEKNVKELNNGYILIVFVFSYDLGCSRWADGLQHIW